MLVINLREEKNLQKKERKYTTVLVIKFEREK
jgi:hypothetical protein